MTMNLRLERRTSGGALATCGTVYCPQGLVLATLEPPWRDNAIDQSCVPPGDYELIPYLSEEHGATWKLHNPQLRIYGVGLVPEGCRDDVEIHSGNVPSDTLGCILIGISAGTMLDPKSNLVAPAVYDSDVAVQKLRALLGRVGGNTLSILAGQ